MSGEWQANKDTNQKLWLLEADDSCVPQSCPKNPFGQAHRKACPVVDPGVWLQTPPFRQVRDAPHGVCAEAVFKRESARRRDNAAGLCCFCCISLSFL
jgi:hypothetical protein